MYSPWLDGPAMAREILGPGKLLLVEQKVMLESDPALAAEVVRNANRYVATFRNRTVERLTSLLVLQKYFEATGQLPASAFTTRFFA